MKFDVIVADCPWPFDDKITMSDVKRGAEAQYAVLDIEAIKKLKVNELTAENAVLALWVPSSLLQAGLDTMKEWGFRQTQTQIWVKTKLNVFDDFKKWIRKSILKHPQVVYDKYAYERAVNCIIESLQNIDYNDLLAFGMGRLFRQTHEVCLMGVKGKPYSSLANKSQRSVHFASNLKHSAKPEILQDRLELMFPKAVKFEMFARRSRPNWTCVGLECPDTLGEDIHNSIDRLIKLP